MKTDLLGSLIHELRTPLNAILGWVQLAKRKPGDAALLAEAMGVIERNSRLQAKLLMDFSDIHALQNNDLRMQREILDVGQLISAAVDAVITEVSQSGFKLDLPQIPCIVAGDSDRLCQIIQTMLRLQMESGTPAIVAVSRLADRGQVQISVHGDTPDTAAIDLANHRLHSGSSLEFRLASLLAAGHGGQLLTTQDAAGHLILTLTLPLTES